MLRWLNPFKWWNTFQLKRGEHLTDLEKWHNLNQEVVKLYSSGDISAAIPIAGQALELAEKIFPDDSNDLANSLNNLAALYEFQCRWAEAELLYFQALGIRKKLFPDPNKPNNDLAANLSNLAGLYKSQGRWAEAEPLLIQVLGIRKKLFTDPNKPNNDLANSINNLAVLYEAQRRWTEAEPLLIQALEIKNKLFPDPNKPNNNLAYSLSNLAGLYESQGRWAEAEPLYIQALGIREKLFPEPNKPNNDLADSLHNLAGLYRSQGRWAEAEPLLIQALGIRKKLFPEPNKPNNDLARSLNNLAGLYESQGRWAEAEPLYIQALGIRKKLFPEPNKPNNDLAASLSNLAGLYHSQGRWAEAELLYVKNLEIQNKLFPEPNKPNNDIANSLNNLAGLYESQGRWAEAEFLFVQALEIRKKLFPDPNKPNNDLANSLNSLAVLYCSQERWAEAEPLYIKALEIKNKLFPDPNKPNNDLAASLNNLASLYLDQGRWAEAEPLLIQTLGIRKKLFPDPSKPNNDLATSLNNLAFLYRSQGRWAEAESLCVKALAIWNKLFGENGHPSLVVSLISLAITQSRRRPDVALPLFQQAIATENRWFINTLPNNDSQQRLKTLEESQQHLEYLLALTQQHFPQDSDTVTTAFNAVLNRKAQAASAEASFSQAIRNYPHLAPQLQQLQDYQQEIATLSYAAGNQPELIDQLNNLLQQRSSLERILGKSIPALDLQWQVVYRLALTTLLPTNSFLLEFIRYNDFDFANSKWQDARYLVFIVKQDQAGITMLDCGLAEPLDKAINNFRNAQAQRDFGGQNSGMRDALKPPAKEDLAAFLNLLLPHLPATGTCFFAPDSHLHILPFHLLKTPSGEYFGDRYQIHYLNTARDLLRRQIVPSTNPPLVLADPDYDGSNVIPFPQNQDIALTNPKLEFQVSDAAEEQRFEPLPINKILGELVAAAYQVPCYSGIEATIDRFKQVNSPQLLMIATHGFSLPPQTLLEMLRKCPIDQEENIISRHQSEITSELREFWQKQAGSEDGQRILAIIDRYGIRPPATDILNTPTSDPMLRCGFALAGANIWRFKGVESPLFGKGIIFAQDVMQCNLWGTELALIATCVSGMGEVKNSEGVFGLRRALAIAGAKYVITSLWNIPTKPSALLMEKFFELYKSGMPPATALAAAQRYVRDITLGDLKKSKLGSEVIAELKEGFMQISKDTPEDIKPLAHPYFWGAWICQG